MEKSNGIFQEDILTIETQTGRKTAIRELKEEMGIPDKDVDVVGSLGYFQTINNKSIKAFVGIWNKKTGNFI